MKKKGDKHIPLMPSELAFHLRFHFLSLVSETNLLRIKWPFKKRISIYIFKKLLAVLSKELLEPNGRGVIIHRIHARDKVTE